MIKAIKIICRNIKKTKIKSREREREKQECDDANIAVKVLIPIHYYTFVDKKIDFFWLSFCLCSVNLEINNIRLKHYPFIDQKEIETGKQNILCGTSYEL